MTHILSLKKDHFVLWGYRSDVIPQLVVGKIAYGNPSTLNVILEKDLQRDADFDNLWTVKLEQVADQLQEGGTYHYFFRLHDSNPYKDPKRGMLCTDPLAGSVDWNLRATSPGSPYGDGDIDPAGVFKIHDGQIVPSDAGGEMAVWGDDDELIPDLPPNNQLVIYEIPPSWAREGEINGKLIDVGSFQDVLALLDRDAQPVNFSGVRALEERAHLLELGVNGVQFTPSQDSWVDHQWGYATSNYLSPDWDLGKPAGNTWSTAVSDLSAVVRTCHREKIRFFIDIAMGFANHCPLENVNFLDFHVRETDKESEVDPEKDDRQNWGGQLFKYDYQVRGYNPLNGRKEHLFPAREYMKVFISHWIDFYKIDGIRIDSIKTIKSWNFVRDFKNHARAQWKERLSRSGHATGVADPRFLVVGEILDAHDEPELVKQDCVDGVWNDEYKKRVRYAIIGKNWKGDKTFEETIRKLIDPRALGYWDTAHCVNYVGCHDKEGLENERLYDYLGWHVYAREERIKLAFVCLMTSIGVPMILAGDEFGDSSDLKTTHPEKQMDAVNFERMNDEWRRRLFNYVARLVRLRTSSPALGTNEIDFFHVDFNEGKRVMAWRRGFKDSQSQVVVVANFSEWGTADPGNPNSEYRIPNWPATPPGKRWHEVTQDRDVPDRWAGREPLYPWQAKVYQLTERH